MWLKVLLALLVVLFCVFLGYLAAEKYRKRRSFFAQFCDFNETFLSELAFSRKPLPELLRESAYTGEFAKLLKSALARKIECDFGFLSPAERENAVSYFSMLGKGDARAQSGFFSARRAQLVSLKEESAKEAKSRGELYLKLGLLAGLALVILIV